MSIISPTRNPTHSPTGFNFSSNGTEPNFTFPIFNETFVSNTTDAVDPWLIALSVVVPIVEELARLIVPRILHPERYKPLPKTQYELLATGTEG